MEGLKLKKLKYKYKYKFGETLCIICQKKKYTELTSTVNCQTQVRKASKIYQDIVWERLKPVDKDVFSSRWQPMLQVIHASKELEQKLRLLYYIFSLFSIVLVVIGFSLFICQMNSYNWPILWLLVWLNT